MRQDDIGSKKAFVLTYSLRFPEKVPLNKVMNMEYKYILISGIIFLTTTSSFSESSWNIEIYKLKNNELISILQVIFYNLLVIIYYKFNNNKKKHYNQAKNYIKENVLKKFGSTGVQEILNKAVFEFLDYITVFPVEKGLQDKQERYIPDCFLMKKGSTALNLAFKVHTDVGKGFIKAINVKTKQAVGKEYELKDRDVIEIVFKA